MGKTDSECSKGCTNSIRLTAMGKTAAHELGHILGMDHDFDTAQFNKYHTFKYRKYGGKSCKGGLMSYTDPRSGWSKCGQRDFSRYLTSGGTKKPCTFGSKIKVIKGGCTQRCASVFKQCVQRRKMYGESCSNCYRSCRIGVNRGNYATECKKGCTSTKKMAALKSSC